MRYQVDELMNRADAYEQEKQWQAEVNAEEAEQFNRMIERYAMLDAIASEMNDAYKTGDMKKHAELLNEYNAWYDAGHDEVVEKYGL